VGCEVCCQWCCCQISDEVGKIKSRSSNGETWRNVAKEKKGGRSLTASLSNSCSGSWFDPSNCRFCTQPQGIHLLYVHVRGLRR
jgi:hypothetical protein